MLYEHYEYSEFEGGSCITGPDVHTNVMGFWMNKCINDYSGQSFSLLIDYIEQCCKESKYLTKSMFDYIQTHVGNCVQSRNYKKSAEIPDMSIVESSNLWGMGQEDQIKYIMKNHERLNYIYTCPFPEFFIVATLDYAIHKGLVIKKCKMCDRYFFPFSKSNEQYCDFTGRTTNKGDKYASKTCKEANEAISHEKYLARDTRYKNYKKVYDMARKNHKVTSRSVVGLKEEYKIYSKLNDKQFFEWLEAKRLELSKSKSMLKEESNNG